MVKICPICNERYGTMPHTGDFVHDCSISSSSALANEDVLRMQSWTDYDGSGSMLGPTEFMMQGIVNNVWGQRADIEGEDVESLTARGKRESVFRTRRRLTYIKND